ncbi:MAG: hypothetical protein UX08_C0013G0030 [Candidatus Collierbacteria bacterium GW2011_GWB1_45_35]|uniref:Uncharacterized protein n=1 Tax=Candidatus Collierbacteria bacterium GW2011_GWB2_45_17 TaxID=1618388 RepID=A0A837IK76_9BACT|nr:MAG: hypothetical protein UW48_C0008G0030 [Microgenomates group bacterium GW2011_GWC1_44_23]KKT95363.1 MAG: hypothetical protein UW96_C0008G0030 [Candidatus Collierbacteria bacterium GW2011_GWA1_45_15]KKT99586.1 MAG: hypothetical protein UX01_C0009G0016 [Candidatus Collierbacteria bacterium GW2011_GWB2_45_17]KKU04940.1 MAG: hypothetical protein UX08_C0013G0030 [Candidatus Collierbacteria bacterium GW2011_GWB1_45_35]KKU06970.1 MAG: hypothetical protein UX11_C0022G0003 [Candidatus Collierbacte
MFSLSDDQLKAAQDVIRDDPSLIWYTKSYDTLDIRSVVEAVLNCGTWEQTQRLISIIGIDKMAKLFAWHNTQPRSNLHKLARNYYSHYFARYAPKYSHA